MYKPTIWSHQFIQALDDSFPNNFTEKIRELEMKVTAWNVDFENASFSMLELLEHIDHIERLGVGYRFQNHVHRVLDVVTSKHRVDVAHEGKEESIYEASLRFRILRQHGYNVSQDFIMSFKDNHGALTKSLQTDVKGLLSLYEASHLAFMDETDLLDDKLLAVACLLKLKGQESEYLQHINHALELPLYHEMPRLQARYYIDAYGKRQDANLLLLELAALDFNKIQAGYKTELKELSKWWENIGLAHNLSFARDGLVESYVWAVGMVFEPQYGSCRVGLTKVGMLITVIDDIYDVYGSLYELEIFAEAVKRWDITVVEHMPTYLQLGFRALYHTVTEMGSNTSTSHGDDITPILVKVWGELLESFLVEAKWARDKYIPTLDHYLDITHGYFLSYQEIEKDIDFFEKYHDLIKCSSIIFRLYNDFGTSENEVERGKNVNAISCYMNENGVDEKDARAYITTLIDKAWRKLIKVHVTCSQELANPFIEMAINIARMSCCTYQYGDGHGAPDVRAKQQISSVIIEPIEI